MNELIKKNGSVIFLFFTINNTSIKTLNNTKDNKNSINAIIGELSFIKKIGQTPSAVKFEVLRIKTHLAYVENLLGNK